MSVHYKFKSSLDYDTVTFDGLHISVGDLKKSILQQKKIGKGFDFDLQITNAQTKEVYVEDGTLIPKNASVIVSRVPNSLSSKKSWERNDASNLLAAVGNSSSDPFDKATKTADLVSMNASESDKILAMMSQSTQDYDPSRYGKTKSMTGPLPPAYTCFRCGLPGHWIKNCPTNSIDVKRSTGIPRSFMVTVEGPKVPGALLTSTGHYAVPMIDHEAYKEGKKERPPFSKEESPEKEAAPEIPEDLLCVICHDLLSDAVITPCCGNSYCDECIRQALLDSDEHECPTCHVKDVSPDTLIPIRLLRNSVLKFKNQTGYTKAKKANVISNVAESEPPATELPSDVVAAKDEFVAAVGSPRSPAIPAVTESVEEKSVKPVTPEAAIEPSTSPKRATPEPIQSAESPSVTSDLKVEAAAPASSSLDSQDPVDERATLPAERVDNRGLKLEPLMSKIIADPPFVPRGKEQDFETRQPEPDFDSRRSSSRDRRPTHRQPHPDAEDDRKLYPMAPASLGEHPGTPVRDEYGAVDYPGDGNRYPPNYRHEHQFNDDYGRREEPSHVSETFTIQTVLTTRGDWQPDEPSSGSYQMPQSAPLLDPNSRNSRDPHHHHHHHQQQQPQHISRKDNNNQTSHLMPIDVSNITGTPVPVVSQSARDEQTQLSVAYTPRTGPPGAHPPIGAPPGTYSSVLPLGGRPGGPPGPPPHLMNMSAPGGFDVRQPPPNVPIPSLFHAPPPSLLRRPPMLPPPGTGPHGISAGQPLPPGVVPPPVSSAPHSLPPPPGVPYQPQQHPYPQSHPDNAYGYGGGLGYGDGHGRDRNNRDPLDAFARELFEYQREGRRHRRRSSSSRSYSSRSSYSRSSRSRSHSSRSRSYSSRSRSKSYSRSRSRSRSQYSRRTRSGTRSRTRSPRSRSRTPKHSPPPHKKKSRTPPGHKRRPSPSSLSRRHPDFIPAPGSNFYGGGNLYRGGMAPNMPNVPQAGNQPYDAGRGRYGGDHFNRYDAYQHHQFEHHPDEAAASHQYDMRDSRYNRGGGGGGGAGGYVRYDEYYRGGGSGYQRHSQHQHRAWQGGGGGGPANLMDVRARPVRELGRRGGGARGGGMSVDPGMMKPPLMDKPSLGSRERVSQGRGPEYGGGAGRGQDYMGAGRNQEYAGQNRGGQGEYPPSHRSEYGMHHRGQDYPGRGQEYSAGRGPPEYGSSRGHHDYGASSGSARNQEYAGQGRGQQDYGSGDPRGDQRSGGSSRGQDYAGGDQREQRSGGSSSRGQDYGGSFGRSSEYGSSRGGPREVDKQTKHHDDLNGAKDATKENFKPRDSSSKESRSLRKKSGKEEEPRAGSASGNAKSSVGATSATDKPSRSSPVEKSREKKHKRKAHHAKDEPVTKKLRSSKSKGSAEADAVSSSVEADTAGSKSSSSKKSTRKKKKRSKDDESGGSDVAATSGKSSRRHKTSDDTGPTKDEKRTSRDEKVSVDIDRRSRVAETTVATVTDPPETTGDRETSPVTTSFADGEDGVPVDREDASELADDESKMETEEESRAHSVELGSEAPEDEIEGRPDSERRSEAADVETEGDEEHRESPMDEADAEGEEEEEPEEEEDESVLMAPVPELSKWERDDVEATRPDESMHSAHQQYRQSGKKSLPADILHKAEKAILFHKARIPSAEGGVAKGSSTRKQDVTAATPEKEADATAPAVEADDVDDAENGAKDRNADRVKLDRSKFSDRNSAEIEPEATREVEVEAVRKKPESGDEESGDDEQHSRRLGESREELRHHRGHHSSQRHSDRGRSDEERYHHRHRHHHHNDSRDRDRPSHGSRRDDRDVRRGSSRERSDVRRGGSRERSHPRQDDRRGGSRERSDARRGGSRERLDPRRGSSRERASQRHDSRERADYRRGGSRDRSSVVRTEDRDRSGGRHDIRERPNAVKPDERAVTATAARQEDRRRDYSRRNPSPPSLDSRDQGSKDGVRSNRETSPSRIEKIDRTTTKKVITEEHSEKHDKIDRARPRVRSFSDDENSRGADNNREEVKSKGTSAEVPANVKDEDDANRRRHVRRLSSTIDESKFEPNYDDGGGESDHESVSKSAPSKPPPATLVPAAVVTKVSSVPPPLVSAAKVPMAVKRHRSSSSVASSSSSQSGDDSSSPSKKPVKESSSKHGKHKKSKHKKNKHKKSKKKNKKKSKKKDEDKPVKSSVVKH